LILLGSSSKFGMVVSCPFCATPRGLPVFGALLRALRAVQVKNCAYILEKIALARGKLEGPCLS